MNTKKHISILKAFDTGFRIFKEDTEQTFWSAMKISFKSRIIVNTLFKMGFDDSSIEKIINQN